MNEKIFPLILISLNLAASFTYLAKKDIWMFVYWLCAALHSKTNGRKNA